MLMGLFGALFALVSAPPPNASVTGLRTAAAVQGAGRNPRGSRRRHASAPVRGIGNAFYRE